jgi:DNA-binding CsgD family transcriptional regulator
MGRTSLLHEATALAARRGMLARHVACDLLAGLEPPGPLLTALADGSAPAAGQRLWCSRLTAAARDTLERLAADAPVLVTVDDLQWADPVTLAALVALADQLAGQRILWLVAVRAGTVPPLVATALDRLARGTATRLEVGPLDRSAVTEVIADVLHACPEPGLAAALAGTETQPLHLVELLRGLREEGMIAVTRGTARLAGPGGLPYRVRDLIAGRLHRLSADARLTVQLGAALGHTFTGTELATMAGRAPAALVPVVEEAVTAGLLVPHGEHLGFRHDTVRAAVEASITAASFAALRHQAATVRPGPVLRTAALLTDLTESELRVARLAAAGSTNREIAGRLHVSPHTVNTHLRHIFDKVGVRSRVGLARIMAERAA